MSLSQKLRDILAVVQEDVCRRGLAADPLDNLLTACPGDFAAACHSLASHPSPTLDVVTGFWIPSCGHGETDGPLGAVWLARTLPALGIRVTLTTDPFCIPSLRVGLHAAACAAVPVLLPAESAGSQPSHRLAIERVGPSHTPASVRAQEGATDETVRRFLAEVPQEHHGRCHTMRGVDISANMQDVSNLFEGRTGPDPVTLGIGDGGNEIGMGKVRWPTIRANVPGGAIVACRLATDFLIVAGVSNWGAYALGGGLAVVRGVVPPAEWFDVERERVILAAMVEKGPLVDGVRRAFTVSVDGLDFEDYARPLRRIERIVRG